MEDIKHGHIDKLTSKFKKKKAKIKEETPAEPLVKVCPYCYSEINYKATKCPHCTSDIAK